MAAPCVSSTTSSPVFKYSCANLRIDVGHVAVYLRKVLQFCSVGAKCYNFAARMCNVVTSLLVASMQVMVSGGRRLTHMAV